MKCRRCNRPLSDPESIRNGIGPVCAAREQRDDDRANRDSGDKYDLPFDPETMDIVCQRDAENEFSKHFNIAQRIVSHSPTGMEWGYGGSGPADFALNIADLFIRKLMPTAAEIAIQSFADDRDRRPRVKLTELAWALHQDLKRDFVAKLPQEGGTIRGHDLIVWMIAKLEEIAPGSVAVPALTTRT